MHPVPEGERGTGAPPPTVPECRPATLFNTTLQRALPESCMSFAVRCSYQGRQAVRRHGKLCGAEPRAAPPRRAKLSSDTDAIEIFLVTPQTPQGAAGGAAPPDAARKAHEREAGGAGAAAAPPARTPPPLLKHEGRPRFPAGERRAARAAGRAAWSGQRARLQCAQSCGWQPRALRLLCTQPSVPGAACQEC